VWHDYDFSQASGVTVIAISLLFPIMSQPDSPRSSGADALEKSLEDSSESGVDARIDRPTRAAASSAAKDQPPSEQWDPAFEVHWEGDNDPDNPQTLSTSRKWLQVFITSSTSTCVTCVSSMYTSTYGQMMHEFGISEELAVSGLSLFVFALGLSPMIFSPMSEFYGRRPVYILSMGAFVVWLVPCAVAQNIQTMLVARFFNGLVGSAFLSVAGGTVGDLFTKRTLQLPMLVFTSAPLYVETMKIEESADSCQYGAGDGPDYWRLHQLVHQLVS
jgi:hypothetical protein